MIFFGWALLIMGVFVLILSGFFGVAGIANLAGLIIGMTSFLSGSIFISSGRTVDILNGDACSKKTPWGAKYEPAVSEVWKGERDVTQDAYKIFLVKKYDIRLSQVLEGFSCVDRLFKDAEGALKYANFLDEKEAANEENMVVKVDLAGPKNAFKIETMGTGLASILHEATETRLSFASEEQARIFLNHYFSEAKALSAMRSRSNQVDQ